MNDDRQNSNNGNSVLIRTAPHRYFQQSERTYLHEARGSGKKGRAEHATHVVDATAEIAQRLEIEPGAPTTQTTYLTFIDDQPNSTSVSWENLAITAGTAIEKPHEGPEAESGLNTRFAAIGWSVNQIEEHVIVRRPTTAEISVLRITNGESVVEIRQTVRASKNGTEKLVTVEAADIVFPANRVELRYLMDKPK